MEVVSLHENQDLISQLCDLLNTQWPRSKQARLRSLEQSSEIFPTSLVLVENKDKTRIVLGHSKILPVPFDKESCFVESVLIAPHLRGKGLGKMLMEETEKFVNRNGVKTVYLTTHDQQDFYKKIGYEFCDPVIIYGGGNANFYKKMMDLQIKEGQLEESDNQSKGDLKIPEVKIDDESKDDKSKLETDQDTNERNIAPAPPPPPPSPLFTSNFPHDTSPTTVKVTMKKVLS